MNKNEIVQFQNKIRSSKDALKKEVLTSKTGVSHVKIVIPTSLYIPQVYTNADQWYFNGFIIDNNGELMVVDPGVDFYSRFTTTGYDFAQISTLIISHNHIDHTSSAPLFIEKLMKFKNPNHRIYISKDAWDTKIPEYIKEKSQDTEYEKLICLLHGDHGDILEYGDSSVCLKFLALYHSCPDTFGFSLRLNGSEVGYISDTGYAVSVETTSGVEDPKSTTGEHVTIIDKHQYIADFYRSCITVIVNVNDLDYNRHSKYHLSGWDVLDILRNSVAEKLILHHLASVDAEGEDSNYLYKLFFADEEYKTLLPHFTGRIIEL